MNRIPFDISLRPQIEAGEYKVEMKDGRSVRIICWDRKAESGNIVGLVGEREDAIYVWDNDGKHIVSGIQENDLFLVPKEQPLTEFEKAIQVFIDKSKQGVFDPKSEDDVREVSKKLIDIARKELFKEMSDGKFEILLKEE